MRLGPQERQAISEIVHQHFGEQAQAWLFGSRVDDQARGGDIDLLIQVPWRIDNDFLEAIALESDLQEALGDQKIDILLSHPGRPETLIHRIAPKIGAPV